MYTKATLGLLLGMVLAANAIEFRRKGNRTGTSAAQNQLPQELAVPTGAKTFKSFYDNHALGRGIWKWGNALVAYQRHFGAFMGHPVDIAEVGVQSGGSLLMWQDVFGPSCHCYGLDINPQCLKFKDAKTTITIGDQGDMHMWQSFFAHTTKSLDILVDDGGHEPHQMLVTLSQVFPNLNNGGFISIEDIHGLNYVESFFKPAAAFIAQSHAQGQVASVHIYPFVLIVHKAGVSTKLPPAELSFSGSTVTVDNFNAMWQAIQTHKGGHVILENVGWGPFLTEQGLINFFSLFGRLHEGKWSDFPVGCSTTAAPVCTNTVQNSDLQNAITGVHVYPTRLVVEVAAAPPVINAVRRGTEWMKYG